jgi:hypothetical protein
MHISDYKPFFLISNDTLYNWLVVVFLYKKCPSCDHLGRFSGVMTTSVLISGYMSRVMWSKSSFPIHVHSLLDHNAAASHSIGHLLRRSSLSWFTGEFDSGINNVNT